MVSIIIIIITVLVGMCTYANGDVSEGTTENGTRSDELYVRYSIMFLR